MKKTLCLDFDGVIHSYKSGWKGANIIPDPPVIGAREAIAKLRESWRVVVYSSRSGQDGGKQAMSDWFINHDIQVDELCDHKPPAFIYVDDRGITFNGNWDNLIQDVNNFVHWMKLPV